VFKALMLSVFYFLVLIFVAAVSTSLIWFMRAFVLNKIDIFFGDAKAIYAFTICSMITMTFFYFFFSERFNNWLMFFEVRGLGEFARRSVNHFCSISIYHCLRWRWNSILNFWLIGIDKNRVLILHKNDVPVSKMSLFKRYFSLSWSNVFWSLPTIFFLYWSS